MPESIEHRRRERRRAAWMGAWSTTVLHLLAALVLLGLRRHFALTGFLRVLLLGLALADLGLIVPVWISLKERLIEIEGGEEDAAAQY